jgi:ribonucleoside-diphosphate reductase alpha chain
MGEKEKFLITSEGRFDAGAVNWDDPMFTDLLLRSQPINTDQARGIGRFVREAIARMEVQTIPVSVIEKLIEDKLMEYGLTRPAPVKLDKTLFVKNALRLSENAVTVLKKRYLRKDSQGKVIETPEKMFRRVAHHIARAEKNYGADDARMQEVEEIFHSLMTQFVFLPNSPTLMNAGRRLGQLAACFVLPVEDTMEGIFGALRNAALIHKSGGGTGFSFSRLRAKNSNVGTTGGVASGPVSFMKIFNTATEQVKQGGTRRGANMAILRVDHPDIVEFITSKSSGRELNNFNISVGVTDAFMQAAAAGSEYDLLDPRDQQPVGRLNAAEVYEALVTQAWKTGDPGIIFLDRMNAANPTPELGAIESTNPCGEQPLLPMEACNLGSVNLAKFVVAGDRGPMVDYPALKDAIGWSVRFLDDTIDMSRYPLDEITEMVRGNRKIGLGVMGFADMLYQLGIPYNSEEGLQAAGEIMRFFQEACRETSQALAEERGTFPNWERSVYREQGLRLRNATTTTIAPTGTLSIIAGCSSGIEPLFALSFVRTVMDNDKLMEVNPVFDRVARERGFYTAELMDEVARQGSIHAIDAIPEDVRRVFVTAHDVSPDWHIRMQAAFQQFTDNAVSKTVNLPRDATIEDVRKVYDLAFQLNCKGVTIYRDGSKENQVLSFGQKKEEVDRLLGAILDRPETLAGFTTKIKTGYGHLYVTVTEFEGRPFEVFATIGKSGRSTTAKTEAIGRLVSLALRAGVTVDKIVDQLKGIGGEHPIFQDGGLVLSIPDAIARVLEKRYPVSENSPKYRKTEHSLLGEKCPECGQVVSFEEGCLICHFCGFNKCG